MQAFLRRDEASELPFVDFDEQKEVEFITDQVPRHRTRKPRTTTNLPPSPAVSTMPSPQGNSGQDPFTMEPKWLTRQLDRGAPGDAATSSMSRTPEQKQLAKKKSQYYGEVFSYRESNTSARERVNRESMVIADVRTNVIINDEYTFTTDLSYNLSTRYQRPESSILVTITHSACLLLGGSFDPAYSLTITALPSQVQPVTNKRNALLLQRMLEDLLSVPPSRGIVKFVQLSEENFAFNGRTYSGQIEELEKEHAEDISSLKRTLSRSGLKTGIKKQSMRNMRSQKMGAGETLSPHLEQPASSAPPLRDVASPQPGPGAVASGAPPPPNIPLPATPQEKSLVDRKAEKAQKMSRRKSFMSGLFGKQFV